jgi:lysophospholipase L1-like esterase
LEQVINIKLRARASGENQKSPTGLNLMRKRKLASYCVVHSKLNIKGMRFSHCVMQLLIALLPSLLFTGCKNENVSETSKIFKYSNKAIVFFGDSYTAGSGASSHNLRYSTKIAEKLNAEELNFGVAGSTLEKRAPVDYQGAPNMVDRLSSVPEKDATMAIAIIAMGLNDVGQNGPDYNKEHYMADYRTVINHFLSKGWTKSELILISPYYIGKKGYDRYAAISGNPAPSRGRHIDFVRATKAVADFYGLSFIDMFHDQIANDTTLLAEDGIHPSDAGHAFIATDIYNFLNR